MTGVLIHDGRRGGHHTWAVNAITMGAAAGVFISPFSTPRFAIPRYRSGGEFAKLVADVGGEVIFDAMTHGRFLPGANRTDLYDSWELWGDAGVGVTEHLQRQQHVERVFARQSEIRCAHLAPTITVDTPASAAASTALEMGWVARGIDDAAWQSLAGTRGFWRGGATLDAHIGSLVELRAPVWVVTVTNELVTGQVPDLSDRDAFEGLLRTIHSLSERSRVILTHSDFSGLPGIAAGADSLGAGWDRAMRTLDPTSFHVDSDSGIRIPASYVTQKGLSAVLRRDAAEAIERWDPTEAERIRGGAMPPSDRIERLHHLQSLTAVASDINALPDRDKRVARLRSHYERASADFDTLIAAVGPSIRRADKEGWLTNHLAVLKSYAEAEGLW